MDNNKQKAGRAGAAKTWGKRWEQLVELSKILDKETHNKVMKWKTKQIEILFNYTYGRKS